jgi:hypothetical protein
MQKQQGISSLVGILIIIAVAIIAFGGVFAYQYFAKPQTPITNVQNPNPETAGWKTYVNNDLGIEFKYPETINYADIYVHAYKDVDTNKDINFYMYDALYSKDLSEMSSFEDENKNWIITPGQIKSRFDGVLSCDLFYNIYTFGPLGSNPLIVKPNICKVLKYNGKTIVYGIEGAPHYESLPSLGSFVYILDNEKMIELFRLTPQLDSYNNEIKNFGKVDWATPRFAELDKRLGNLLDKAISQPTQEAVDNFNILEKIVKTFKFTK